MSHDRERLGDFASVRRPQTAGVLMQFLQAVNWLQTSLPRLAEVVEPLRVLLEGTRGNPTPDQASHVEAGDRNGRNGSASR